MDINDAPPESPEKRPAGLEDEEENPDPDAAGGDDDGLDGLEMLPPDHPLLAPFQEKLKNQLERELTQAKDVMRKLDRRFSTSSKKHETVGVDLYNAQQRLGQSQISLEALVSRVERARQERVVLQDSVKKREEDAKDAEASLKSLKTEVEKIRNDVEKLVADARDIEIYNNQVKDEIAVARRGAYRTEVEVQQLEAEKKVQDFALDAKERELRKLESDVASLTSQVEAQAGEHGQAQAILAEADAEMDAIRSDKEQLAHQWEAAILALAKRNDALSEARAALDALEAEAMVKRQEVDGIRKIIEEEEAKQANADGRMKAAEEETTDAKDKIAEIDEAIEAKSRMLDAIFQSTTEADVVAADLTKQLDRIGKDIASLDREIEVADNSRTQLLNSVAALQGDTELAGRKALYALQEVKKARERLEDQRRQTAAVTNELAKAKLDCLNLNARISGHKSELANQDARIADSNAIVTKYEVEIKRSHDLIEKKSSDVIRLNRKLDAARSKGSNEEGSAPLETVVSSLQRQIQGIRQECADLEARWLKGQSMLVSHEREREALWAALQMKQKQHAILVAKRDSTNVQAESIRKQIALIDISTEQAHRKIQTASARIAEKTSKQNELGEANFVKEQTFLTEVAELEEECKKTKEALEDARKEQASIRAAFIETEKQRMFWQRKITVESEIQAQVSPAHGLESEAGAMRRAIARMKLRASQLAKEQQALLKRMEIAVDKREVLANRQRAIRVRQSSVTKTPSKTDSAQLRAELKRLEASIASAEDEIRARTEECDRVRAEIEEANAMVDVLKSRLAR